MMRSQAGTCGSDTTTFVKAVFPVFVTVIVNTTVSPTSTASAVDALVDHEAGLLAEIVRRVGRRGDGRFLERSLGRDRRRVCVLTRHRRAAAGVPPGLTGFEETIVVRVSACERQHDAAVVGDHDLLEWDVARIRHARTST